MTTFAELGVRSRTLDTLARMGVTSPKTVQTEALPALLERQDAVIEAPTGSGKTLAFVLPLVERLHGHAKGGARALVVTPTRELAGQINDVLRAVDPGLRTVLLIGGVGYGKQSGQLTNSPDVVIGCPGRILDMANQGIFSASRIEYLVLDEADEMLDQGFARDVEKIIALSPTRASATARQTVLASATMPEWVQTMIAKHLTEPARIRAVHDDVPALEHGILRVRREEKLHALRTLLNRQATTALPQTIVFHRTKHGAKKLARDLNREGIPAGELQGNLSQNARDRAIGDFRSGATKVLVATNVAARGIDVGGIGLVVNFELPETAQWLTHRVGRTARNGQEGVAITMLSDEDDEQWRKLRRLGAPALPTIDAPALLGQGDWVTTAAAPDPTPQRRVHAPQQQRPRMQPRPAGQQTDSRTDRSQTFRRRRHRPAAAGVTATQQTARAIGRPSHKSSDGTAA